METLTSLKRQATECAEWRGHKLVWSAPHRGEYRSVQYAECCKCGASVSISTNPLPNEIDIGGSAVAIGCK